MYCMDCLEVSEQQTAIGICIQCGAAVCPAHARVSVRHLAPRLAALS
jgi:hypothetical protein